MLLNLWLYFVWITVYKSFKVGLLSWIYRRSQRLIVGSFNVDDTGAVIRHFTWLESTPINRIKWSAAAAAEAICAQQVKSTASRRRRVNEWTARSPAAKRQTPDEVGPTDRATSKTNRCLVGVTTGAVIRSLMTALLQSVQSLVRCYWLLWRVVGRCPRSQTVRWTDGRTAMNWAAWTGLALRR